MMTPARCAEYAQKESPEDASEYVPEWQRTAACHRRIRHAAKHNSKA